MTDYLPDRPEPAWSPSSLQHCPSLPGWTRRCLRMCPACWESESFHFSYFLSYSDLQRTIHIHLALRTLVQSLFRQGAPERPPEPLSPPGIWWTGTDLVFRYSRNLVIRYSRECYWSDYSTIWLSEYSDFSILIWSSPFQDPFDRRGRFWPGRQVMPYLMTSCNSRNLGADKAMLYKPLRSQTHSLTTWCYQSHRGWLRSISGSQEGKVCSLQGAG